VIEATAPVRICDLGGWTDTWFGAPGRVLNLAVTPGVRVTAREAGDPGTVTLQVAAFGDCYRMTPGDTSRTARHPLLEAAIDASPPPADIGVELTVDSAVPAGCAAGTSAAVAVATLGALGAARGAKRNAREIAYAAHDLEVGVLGGESGIQDQLCVASGGINYLEIDPYPESRVFPLPAWDALDDRLSLLYLGRAHDSSAVHRKIIGEVTERGPEVFAPLRDAATAARDAALGHDLEAFGRAMIANTDAQGSLDPRLVGVAARQVIGLAEGHGALGWKVNGAGGDGGSVTVLGATRRAKERFEESAAAQGWQVLPVRISSKGLLVRGTLAADEL
jgi:D-glycero-alpha-D-manno-heptose-7-phosphate kinase